MNFISRIMFDLKRNKKYRCFRCNKKYSYSSFHKVAVVSSNMHMQDRPEYKHFGRVYGYPLCFECFNNGKKHGDLKNLKLKDSVLSNILISELDLYIKKIYHEKIEHAFCPSYLVYTPIFILTLTRLLIFQPKGERIIDWTWEKPPHKLFDWNNFKEIRIEKGRENTGGEDPTTEILVTIDNEKFSIGTILNKKISYPRFRDEFQKVLAQAFKIHYSSQLPERTPNLEFEVEKRMPRFHVEKGGTLVIQNIAKLEKTVSIVDSVVSNTSIEASETVVKTEDLASFACCPFCGKDLNLPKTPKFCPFCKEEIGL